MARVEFYHGSTDRHMAVLDDGAVPRVGEFVNIRKVTWLIRPVTWAVVHDPVDGDPRPAFAFPGIWPRYSGPVKKDGPHVDLEVYAFLTTTPNELVATVNTSACRCC